MIGPPLDGVSSSIARMEASPTMTGSEYFVSLTRRRLRSLRFVPAFALDAIRTRRQCSKAPGFQRGALLMDRKWTFWTLTQWDTQANMRAYMTTGDHKTAMPKLLEWCDQASVAHWHSASTTLPDWSEADRRMRAEGRISKVRNPAPGHADMSFAAPRTTAGGPIQPAR